MPGRSCPFLLLALCAFAPPALAQPYPAQIDLSWNDCVLGAYSVDMANACTSNAGSMTMYAAFAPPGTIAAFLATSAVIDLQTSAATLSPWWHLESSGCRNTSLTMNMDFRSGPFACGDPWKGNASGGFDYSLPNGARIRVAVALPSDQSSLVDNSKIWYAFSLAIDNAKSVGAGSCAGCQDGACIVLNQMNLVTYAPAPDVVLTSGPQQYVTYRVGAGAGPICPQATPTRHGTWGSIKSLYR